MAPSKTTVPIRKTIRKLFPTTHIECLARETGAVVRQRKVKIADFFWTLVLGFGVGRKRTIAGLRRQYEKTSGQSIEESSFYDRFTPGLVKMLKQCVAHALEQSLGVGRALDGHLETFRDVIMTDSTVIRLHDLLEGVFPACRTNHTKAALKAHAVISVTGAGRQSIKITSERRHDGPVFQVGKWVAGRLLLFDLGYFRYQLFDCITRNRGYFVSRLKSNSNPTIVAINRKYRGRAVPVIGRKLRDILEHLQREVLDVMVEVRFQHRRYAGKRSYGTQILRVVGVRDEASGEYHLYITNLPTEKLAAKDIKATYALRWQVELLFKEWKQSYRLEDMPSRKVVVVEALLHAAILTLVVSRQLLDAVRKRLQQQAHRLKDARWGAVFESVAADLLRIVLRPPREVRHLERDISRTILHEAPDPNASRPSLLQAVESGVHSYGRPVARPA
jgi:putative transposase